jgi:ATP-dependent RNA helicase RhlE
MPKQIEELSQAYLTDPVWVEVSPSGRAADNVNQSVHFIGTRSKVDLLKSCLAERPGDLSLVFARTKHGAEKLMKTLVASGFSAASIHGNKSQGQRERAIKAFRDGEVRILVATDVAARGIDIPGVSHVYNFDLPEVPENYVHRIGRTARAGAGGEAVAFCGPDDARLLREIERLMGTQVAVASGERPQGRQPSASTPRGRSGGNEPRRKAQGDGEGGGNGQSRAKNRRRRYEGPDARNGAGKSTGGGHGRPAQNGAAKPHRQRSSTTAA